MENSILFNLNDKSEPKDDEILVSVSCIAYNHEKYIRRAIEGFLMQKTDFRYEILIHDDASTDKTADIIREYENAYPGLFRPVYQIENQYSKGISNISGAFNFPRARGKYIAMCEGDDYWIDPYKLQKQADYMEANQRCSMTCHSAGIEAMDKAFRSSKRIRPFEESRLLTAKEVICKKTNFPTASLMFRTDLAKQLPEWYHKCPIGDIPIHLFMLSKGSVYYFDEQMSMYRTGNEGSWQASMDVAKKSELDLRWENHYRDMTDMYSAFNQDTEGVYKPYTDEALRRLRFLIDLKKENNSAVLDPENSVFFDELAKTEQLLLKIKVRAPSVYTVLQRIWRWVNHD